MEQTGTDTVSRTALTAGDAAGANRLQPLVLTRITIKKGLLTISDPAFNEVIERLRTLNDLDLHDDNLSTLPVVRM